MKKLFLIPLVFLLCFAFSCQQQVEEVAEEPVVDVEADVEAIKDWYERYVAFTKGDNFEGYGDFWADDVVFLPPGAPAAIGKEAVLDFIRPKFELRRALMQKKWEEIKIADNFAFVWTTNSNKFIPRRGGRAVEVIVKEIIIFKRKDDGTWIGTHAIWNGSPLETDDK